MTATTLSEVSIRLQRSSISGAAFSKTKSSDNKDWLVKVGNDTITLQGAASLASPNIVSDYKPNTFTEGNDNYNNTISNVTLDALGGNDNIYNTGSKVKISGGAGKDSIANRGNDVTMLGGTGNDTLYSDKRTGGNKISMDGGKNNDVIINYGTNSTLLGGDGDDTINNYKNGYNNKNELVISDGGENVTIHGGKGNDFIDNRGNNVTFIYKPNDGNDTISGFNATSTLRFGSSTNVSLQTKNKNVIATVGKGKITLSGAASLSAINIQGSAKNDSIRSTVSGAKIDALGGNDTINNKGSKVTIYGCSGNDKIYNYASSKVTLNGGSGADTITNWGSAASMEGGAGNDVIWGDSDKDTLTGGSGNDKLHGEAGNDKLHGGSGNDSLWGGDGNDSLWGGSGKDVFIYKPGEGKDRIFDYESGDMLKILEADDSKGSFTKSKFSGGDLTLTISGDSSVIFDDVRKSDKFNINGTTYKISAPSSLNKKICAGKSFSSSIIGGRFFIGDAGRQDLHKLWRKWLPIPH